MEWPEIRDVTVDTMKLSYDQKIKLLQKESQTLYEYCMQKCLSAKQMRCCITPFAAKRTSIVQRTINGSLKPIFSISIIVAIAAVLLLWTPVGYMLTVHFRLAAIKVMNHISPPVI